ncbi:Na+/proline symporter [Amycolatopsis xylanica]|uniref:Na+/proline symporter n=1 Tax=Amycolatopsis xylanica TaxID=589385 RepID=A0A1H3K4K8_9PSEU|nr:histidine kinase [Amycolatopsis xylanica]SDY47106.1 Na+/proline symporter [Amycolatopsis xylanica]
MLQTWVVVTVSVAYLAVLFAVAFYGDRRADAGRSLISRGTIYALSLTVYATSWTYYGSVGRAATSGVGFLTTYLGPTLMFGLGWLVLRRIIRISRRNRITSLADFISARYGKSTWLGGLVTVIAVLGVVPYIALQLKAVSTTFEVIRRQPDTTPAVPFFQDTALYVALLLAGFAILFGTRHLDATERHEGMVAAIAFESVVKLVAFVAAGVFVTFGLYGGFGDLFTQAAHAKLTTLFSLGGTTATWTWMIVLSGLAVLLLPRQWQVGVVENVDEGHLKRAIWMFPLYLLVINIFVLPIAAAGLLKFGGSVNPDTFVLALPMASAQEALTLLVFVGGLSAATGMIIVETVALSTMVSNSLVVPILLRRYPRLTRRGDLAGVTLAVRRIAIVLVMLLGYAYFRFAGQGTELVSIGLVSFAGVAQFAPAILGGLFWKGGTRNGALAGMSAGFAVWAYTLALPTFADAGLLPRSFLAHGPFGIAALRPQALFGLTGMDPVGHAMFWSMLVNIGGYFAVSLAGRPPTAAERAQAVLFVDALADPERPRIWRGRVTVGELRTLTERFVGADGALDKYARDRGLAVAPEAEAAPELVQHAETLLAGSVGAASARIMIASVVGEEQLRVEEVMELLDEASQVAALEERHRLARELHDSVSQALFSMTLHTRAVELAVQKEGGDPGGPVARGLTELRGLTQGALAEMRAALFQLRPDALHEDGLAEAIRKRAAAIAVRENIRIEVHAPEDRVPLSERAEEELFRVVQEAVHNSVKHAGPSRVDVTLIADGGTLVVEVTDDGTGFDPEEQHPGHLGLDGMRERTRRLGGRLTIASSPTGSTVRAVLPGVIQNEYET